MAALLQQKPDGSGTYTFSSRPRPAQPARKKYREPDEQDLPTRTLYGNLMYDRRIVRGNTYAQHTLPATAQPDPIEIQKAHEAKRRAIARKNAQEVLKPRTPEAVEGRTHIDVQTELYLEELTDIVEESDVQTQTDAFLDRPSPILFIPAKTGIDAATQILDGELFDFNIEVKPILEVLIGKTMEQSLLEVMEEEELANLRSQQRKFEELRNAELVQTQRLEEQDKRHREEKQRRKKQHFEVLKKERETTDKIGANAFAQSYLQDLVPSVFGILHDAGYFYDPVERDVDTYFMTWLMDGVTKELTKARVARTILDGIIREVVGQRAEVYSRLDVEVEKRIRATIQKHAAMKVKKPPTPVVEEAENELPGIGSELKLPDEPVLTIDVNDDIEAIKEANKPTEE